MNGRRHLIADQPIDWLFEDNYSCDYRAGVNLGGVSAEKPRIKPGAVFSSFPILIQKILPLEQFHPEEK